MWKKLYNEAIKVQNKSIISPFIEAGEVAAAILTKKGNIYVGVCIDTACTLGMCAERNAIANMITNGESQIDKVVAVMPDGKVGSPCGACREYMMQLDKDSGEIEILLDLDTEKTIKLKELISDWWGTDRFAEQFSKFLFITQNQLDILNSLDIFVLEGQRQYEKENRNNADFNFSSKMAVLNKVRKNCDNCIDIVDDCSENITLEDFLDSLSEEQRDALVHLSLLWAEKKKTSIQVELIIAVWYDILLVDKLEFVRFKK